MTDHFTYRNPYNQEILGEIAYADDSLLTAIIGRARDAQRLWRNRSLEQRIEVIQAGLAILRQNTDEIVRDVSLQMGKPLAQSQGEFETLFRRAAQSFADAHDALAPDVLPPSNGFVRRIEHAPLGVVLNLAAWNYPLIIPINVIVPALLAGNTVLLKHSKKTPRTGQSFADAFGKLDVPDLVQNVVLSHTQVGELIANNEIDYVAFTGSVEGGRAVYRSAAQSLLDAGLELGGKDPAYVAADADLEFAVENIVDGACYNAGQSCCAIERVYVHRDLYDQFLESATEKLRAYRLGDPLDDATTMGPLASGNALDVLETQVDDATKRGARLLFGGHRIPNSTGNLFQPTLLADCPQDSLVMQEESFGPLLPVTAVDNDDEAIVRMNDSSLGLTASIWTRDLDRAERFGREIEAGTIFQNRADYIDPSLPWTGWKQSGLGSTLSPYGFHHLTRRKAIHFRVENGL